LSIWKIAGLRRRCVHAIHVSQSSRALDIARGDGEMARLLRDLLEGDVDAVLLEDARLRGEREAARSRSSR